MRESEKGGRGLRESEKGGRGLRENDNGGRVCFRGTKVDSTHGPFPGKEFFKCMFRKQCPLTGNIG